MLEPAFGALEVIYILRRKYAIYAVGEACVALLEKDIRTMYPLDIFRVDAPFVGLEV